MTLADFFLAVNNAAIRLANVGGQLELRGAVDAITPEIRAGAAEHKAAILALMPATPSPEVVEAEMPEGARSPGEGTGAATAQDRLWADWRLEWLLEVGTLHLRMRGCQDAGVLARLRPLADATPTNLAAWLALGQQIVQTEHELRQQGKLPPHPWPERAE